MNCLTSNLWLLLLETKDNFMILEINDDNEISVSFQSLDLGEFFYYTHENSDKKDLFQKIRHCNEDYVLCVKSGYAFVCLNNPSVLRVKKVSINIER